MASSENCPMWRSKFAKTSLRTNRGSGGGRLCWYDCFRKRISGSFTPGSPNETSRLHHPRAKVPGVGAAEFAERAAHFLAEVNAIQPFREGNGRTQLSFLKILAQRAGHPVAGRLRLI